MGKQVDLIPFASRADMQAWPCNLLRRDPQLETNTLRAAPPPCHPRHQSRLPRPPRRARQRTLRRQLQRGQNMSVPRSTWARTASLHMMKDWHASPSFCQPAISRSLKVACFTSNMRSTAACTKGDGEDSQLLSAAVKYTTVHRMSFHSQEHTWFAERRSPREHTR